MIKRDILDELLRLLGEYPVVTILGPRQAGKTTLVKSALEGYDYANLEIPEIRQFATDDPKAFLAQFKNNVILDEIQRTPELLSYIQATVDLKQRNGQFVLTGSHQLALREAISQSLAGRTAILHLYPLSIAELNAANMSMETAEDYLYNGFLPRIYDQQQRPTPAYSNYYQTYIERDVRQLIHIKEAAIFEKFIKLLAGRVGQIINYSSLANDVGVNQNTIKHWLSILEASFVIFKASPYFENFGKRVIKAPKYYFVDTGLLAFLLGIENPAQIRRDPLVGQLFENLVVLECLKTQANQGKIPTLYFYRDSNGHEVDLLVPQGRHLIAIEVKYSSTYHPALLKSFKKTAQLTAKITQCFLIYNGDAFEFSDGITALRFNQVHSIFS
jgi:hypothetical protein